MHQVPDAPNAAHTPDATQERIDSRQLGNLAAQRHDAADGVNDDRSMRKLPVPEDLAPDPLHEHDVIDRVVVPRMQHTMDGAAQNTDAVTAPTLQPACSPPAKGAGAVAQARPPSPAPGGIEQQRERGDSHDLACRREQEPQPLNLLALRSRVRTPGPPNDVERDRCHRCLLCLL
jgi:hypothetical protein